KYATRGQYIVRRLWARFPKRRGFLFEAPIAQFSIQFCSIKEYDASNKNYTVVIARIRRSRCKRNAKKIGSFSLIERVILSAGAMLIFSVSFQIDQMPEGEGEGT
ncbi:hypothetical protein GQ607_007291, partial [Colletotrichum asianum]